ncbi:hypothetical protein LWI29_010848 [Acer saccharum]|uniref:Uncharacterized protein n=1 Tax=Acer saccharum TaxID=4024 RepID=A0AA39T298_ACESA|nr:hypothetical protein LWI29_010848 [Acer saccharum]
MIGLTLLILDLLCISSIPLNKKLYTSSYVCLTSGAALVLSAIYPLLIWQLPSMAADFLEQSPEQVDIWDLKYMFLPIERIDMNTMLVYVMVAEVIFAGFSSGWYDDDPHNALCEGRRQAFQKIKKSPTKAVGQLEIDRRLRKVVKGINLEKKADKEGFVTAADKGKGIRIRISKTKQKLTSFYNAKLVIDEKCDDRFRMDSDAESSSSLMESESRGGDDGDTKSCREAGGSGGGENGGALLKPSVALCVAIVDVTVVDAQPPSSLRFRRHRRRRRCELLPILDLS